MWSLNRSIPWFPLQSQHHHHSSSSFFHLSLNPLLLSSMVNVGIWFRSKERDRDENRDEVNKKKDKDEDEDEERGETSYSHDYYGCWSSWKRLKIDQHQRRCCMITSTPFKFLVLLSLKWLLPSSSSPPYLFTQLPMFTLVKREKEKERKK